MGFIVKGDVPERLEFKKVENFEEAVDAECIVVRTLNPDYYLLFSTLKLIITRIGSPLSHLAILAREHGIPIYQTNEELPAEGRLSVVNNEIRIH